MSAAHTDTLQVAGGFLSQSEGTFDAVGHERDTRAPFPVRRYLVGDDEDRHVERMLVLPPAGDVERAAAADDGTVFGHPLVHHDLARVRWGEPTLDAIRLRSGAHPCEQTLSASAEGKLGTVVAPGDEPVQRHAQIDDDIAHSDSSTLLPSLARHN